MTTVSGFAERFLMPGSTGKFIPPPFDILEN